MSVNPEQVRKMIVAESALIDKRGIVSLYEAVHKMMGFGLGGLLYRAGKMGGRQGAEMLAQRLNLQGEDLLEALCVAFNASRWGEAQLDRTQTPWLLRVRDSVLGQHLHNKKPVCYPIAGYWAGFLEVALNRPVEVREVACMALGHPECVFEVHLN